MIIVKKFFHESVILSPARWKLYYYMSSVTPANKLFKGGCYDFVPFMLVEVLNYY